MVPWKRGQRHADLHLDVLQLAFELLDVRVVLLALAAADLCRRSTDASLDELMVMMLADSDEFLGGLLLGNKNYEKFFAGRRRPLAIPFPPWGRPVLLSRNFESRA